MSVKFLLKNILSTGSIFGAAILIACKPAGISSLGAEAQQQGINSLPTDELEGSVCTHFTTSEELLSIDVGGNGYSEFGPKLAIPREYFSSRRWRSLRDGKLDGAIFFQMRLNDYGPLSRLQERVAVKTNPRPSILVLIQPPKSLEIIYNTFAFHLINDTTSHDFSVRPRNEHGLVELKDAKILNIVDRGYIRQIDNQLTDIITCGTSLKVNYEGRKEPNESCNHYISDKNTQVKMSYDSELIENWPHMRAKVLSFIDCALKNHNSSNEQKIQ